jgi:vitamin B6-dependent photo-protection and homoeostasis protein
MLVRFPRIYSGDYRYELNVMQAGSVVVSWISSQAATWTVLVILLVLHLGLNYAAVRAVSLRNINRQRANLLFSHLLAHDKVLSPKQVSRAERIFERDAVLRWTGTDVLGYCRIGVGCDRLCVMGKGIAGVGGNKAANRNKEPSMPQLAHLMDIFKHEEYILALDTATHTFNINIVLKTGCTSSGQLKAWLQALILGKELFDREKTQSVGAKTIAESDLSRVLAIKESLSRANNSFDEYSMRLLSVGWELKEAALETQSGPRVQYW